MVASPHRRVRPAPSSLTSAAWAREQLDELLQQRQEIDARALAVVSHYNDLITNALKTRATDLGEIDRRITEIDSLRDGRPVIARDDYSGPAVEVYHYLDGVCSKRPVQGRIMYEEQAKALGLRAANCRCQRRAVAA